MGRPAYTLEDVWRFVEKRGIDECWPWTGNGARYGAFPMKGEQYRAHRVVYYVTHPGVINLRMNGFTANSDIILHTCDNIRCCNPAHLVLGKPKDNTQDMMLKGRRLNNKGVKHPLSKLSENDVRRMRALYVTGVTKTELGRMFAISFQSAADCVDMKSYQDVT